MTSAAHVAGAHASKAAAPFVATKIRGANLISDRATARSIGDLKTDRSAAAPSDDFYPALARAFHPRVPGVRVISPFFGRERPGKIRRWNPD